MKSVWIYHNGFDMGKLGGLKPEPDFKMAHCSQEITKVIYLNTFTEICLTYNK